MNPYRIVLADDHTMIRHGLKTAIEKKKDFRVVGEASDGIELLELLTKIIPDMVILDISMPKMTGIEATRRIKALYPDVKILILSMYKITEYLLDAFCAGAAGYLLKEDSAYELFSAIETIRRGGIYASPLFFDMLIEALA